MQLRDNYAKLILLRVVAVIIFTISACGTYNKQDLMQPTAAILVSPTTIPIQVISPVAPRLATSTPDQLVKVNTPTQVNDSNLEILLPDCYDSKFSPDNKWAVGYCRYDETWVISIDQTKKWTISYGEYYGSKFNSGNGIITPEYWTTEGRYLYLAIQRGVSGPIYFVNGWGLLRLDLTNGYLSEILKPLQHGYYSFTLDGDNLAYIYQNREPLTLNTVNLRNGNSKSVRLNTQDNQAGAIIWSPDKNQVVLAEANIDYEGKIPDLFSIAIINLDTQSIQMIVRDNQTEIEPTRWLDGSKIELTDREGRIWIFDTIENSLQESTK